MSAGLLLDTCTFLWMVRTPNDLSPAARAAVVDPSRPLFLSVVSHWEIGVKSQIGRLALPDEPGSYVRRERPRHGIESLSLEEGAINHLSKLPDLHRDPFDRMLICQAIDHGLTIVSPDAAIQRYPVRVLW
jgi:PIN domain nuclease of toxin-antitoxin system